MEEPKVLNKTRVRRNQCCSRDICALRLVCKDLRLLFQHILFLVAFEELQVDLTLHHLETSSISDRPNV